MSEAILPADDPKRQLVIVDAGDTNVPHIAPIGDTYTVLLGGKDTAGRYCLIDMHVPPGGGPPPHRHDFEETFVVIEGETPPAPVPLTTREKQFPIFSCEIETL